MYATEGIKLIKNNIVDATVKNLNISKEKMTIGANLSGKAINITRTTAPHSLSYEITRILDIPHGHTVALLLGKFFLINQQISKVRKPLNLREKQVRETKLYKYLGVNNAFEARNMWYKLMNDCGLETNFDSLKLNNKLNIKKFVDNVNVERLKNHPVILTKENLINVFVE